MKIKKSFYAVAAILCLSLCAAFFLPASADTAEEAVIRISPTKHLCSLSPSEVHVSEFQISNPGNQALHYNIAATAYSVEDQYYNTTYQDNGSGYSEIVNWIRVFEPEGTIEPGETKDITFTITTPEDIPSGGQYAAIIVSATAASQGSGNFQTAVGAGLVVYANLAGETHIAGNFLNNSINGFFLEPPIYATSLVENTGNTHTIVETVLQVNNIITGEEIYSNENTPDEKILLPNSKRYNVITWANAPSLGIFRVTQTIYNAEQENTVTKIVVICPLWLIFLIVAFVIFVIVWLASRIIARKKARSSNV